MHKRSVSTATALAVVLGSVALGIGAALPASAAGTAPTAPPKPVTGVDASGIAVDAPLNRVFISDDYAGGIQAVNPSGAVVASRNTLRGVGELAVSGDGARLYASLGNQILALDATTLQTEATYSVPVLAASGIDSVAFAGGKLWFSYTDQNDDAVLGSIDADGTLVADALTLTLPVPSSDMGRHAVELNTSASAPNLLLASEQGTTPGGVWVLDVSSGTPQTVAAQSTSDGSVTSLHDVQLLTGTTGQVLLNGGYQYGYGADGLTAVGSLPNAGQATAAAVSHDGYVAQLAGDDVTVYQPGSAQPLHTFDAGAGVDRVVWAADDSELYALVRTDDGWTLKLLQGPKLSVPTLTVKAPASASRAKKLTVTGKLTGTVAVPAGEKLKITRTDLDSPSGKVISTSVPVGTGGTFSFSDTPPAGGNVWYRVTYAGDAQHAPVAVAIKVAVSRSAPTLTISNSGKTYNHGQKVTFTAHLGSEYKNRTVSIYNDFYGPDWGKKLLKTATVNSAGNVSVPVTMDRDTVLSAVYTGDDRTAPKTVSIKAYAHAKVSLAVSKNYRTGRIGSVDYYWLHKKTSPVLTTTMNAVKGRSERLDLQVYVNGRWVSTDAEYFGLNSSGKAAVTLEAPGQAGIRARVRADYIRFSSGDDVNTTTYGAWKYLYFTS